MSSIQTTNNIYGAKPLNGWSLFFNLAQGNITPGKYWLGKTYRRKFVIRSLCMPFHTYRYLSEMAKNPLFNQIIKAQPGLPCRLQRPWMALGIGLGQKQSSINNHYLQFCHALPRNLIDGYFSDRGAVLAKITGKDQKEFSVKLRAEDFLGKEGEATLQFCDEQNTTLALLTFTLVRYNNKQAIFIGGLQGARNHTPHESIHSATKSCHGLFPKRLLTEAVINLAQQLSAEQVIAVSNRNHIYASWRYRTKKKDKLLADYDEFWQSLGAVQDVKGNFIFPLQMPRKAIEDIASKKRAEYRRRYELLDQISAQITQRCQLPG
ncbi:hypothetical protein BTJ39_02180 [Izhakiella australiensis]|uniref:DUF535 domain-containing protein n=1 Tax=Izhakiella australiensis TaxID=1926881 RepID=A0A1S8YT23_9GAMM|nr:VirK/YbjX family protein [Izhakiella australiensis]OON41986.1 hypothetical protein BTJ39_02180 [Izhakiella australiensis]